MRIGAHGLETTSLLSFQWNKWNQAVARENAASSWDTMRTLKALKLKVLCLTYIFEKTTATLRLCHSLPLSVGSHELALHWGLRNSIQSCQNEDLNQTSNIRNKLRICIMLTFFNILWISRPWIRSLSKPVSALCYNLLLRVFEEVWVRLDRLHMYSKGEVWSYS